jgi:hypothetical protein
VCWLRIWAVPYLFILFYLKLFTYLMYLII